MLEIWGAEYQEQNALLIDAEDEALFRALLRTRAGARSRSSAPSPATATSCSSTNRTGPYPENLELSKVLGDMPQKVFTLDRKKTTLKPLELPKDLTVRKALDRVLRLLSVGLQAFPDQQGRPVRHRA